MHANSPHLELVLEEAARDLFFPSESEAPLVVYHWPGTAEPSPAALLAGAGLPAETPVETTTLESELAGVVAAAPGSDAVEQALAARWKALLDTLRCELTDLRVYRVGKVDLDIYLLGRAPWGEWLGYKTHAVET